MTVTAKVGLHARPVAMLSKLATELGAEGISVKLGRNQDRLVSAASALRLLTLKVASGETVIVELGLDDQVRAESIFTSVAEALAAD
jgi:phosphotransferase system HPr (HPr) family protein